MHTYSFINIRDFAFIKIGSYYTNYSLIFSFPLKNILWTSLQIHFILYTSAYNVAYLIIWTGHVINYSCLLIITNHRIMNILNQIPAVCCSCAKRCFEMQIERFSVRFCSFLALPPPVNHPRRNKYCIVC